MADHVGACAATLRPLYELMPLCVISGRARARAHDGQCGAQAQGRPYSTRERPAPTNSRSFSFLLSQCTLRLNCDTIELGGEDMRHFSVLLIGAGLKTATPAKARLMRGIATAAILLLTIPPTTDGAEAGPGGKGGGFGGHVGVSARGFAGRGGLGFAGGPVGGGRIGGRGIGDRSFGARPVSGGSIFAPRGGHPTARFSFYPFGGTRGGRPRRGGFFKHAHT